MREKRDCELRIKLSKVEKEQLEELSELFFTTKSGFFRKCLREKVEENKEDLIKMQEDLYRK